jgi:hypothetical protein
MCDGRGDSHLHSYPYVPPQANPGLKSRGSPKGTHSHEGHDFHDGPGAVVRLYYDTGLC